MNTKELLKHKNVYLGGAAGGGGVIGAVVGYFAAKRKLTKRFDALLSHEVDEIRQAYADRLDEIEAQYEEGDSIAVVGGPITEVAASTVGDGDILSAASSTPLDHEQDDRRRNLIRYDKMAKPYTAEPDDPEPPDNPPAEEIQNIFDQAPQPPFERDANAPYPIPVQVFQSDEGTFDKLSLVYYAGDNTLADTKNVLVAEKDVEERIGYDNINLIGTRQGNLLSLDPRVVYVRNEALDIDFEVTQEEGAFAVMVMGLDPEDVYPSVPTRRRDRSGRDD